MLPNLAERESEIAIRDSGSFLSLQQQQHSRELSVAVRFYLQSVVDDVVRLPVAPENRRLTVGLRPRPDRHLLLLLKPTCPQENGEQNSTIRSKHHREGPKKKKHQSLAT